jgi:ribonuclease-3 family protein
MVRERIVRGGSVPGQSLQRLAVRRVKASAQALAYDAVFNESSIEERSILKRGRNASLSTIPRSCTPEQYHKATAIEALFGYLYLKGEEARLRELFELIDTLIAKTEEERNAPGR